ncbi:hypothetical protein PsgB076_27260 [Pseudomonas savastanoi pv. glycinea str. B076]|nr:hypothetical protein PsgB076_27260 [Pseudomonas savastanoi pv. glycinea str. B076]
MRLIGQAAPENYLVCPGLSLVPIAQDLEVLVAAAPAAPAAVAALIAALLQGALHRFAELEHLAQTLC